MKALVLDHRDPAVDPQLHAGDEVPDLRAKALGLAVDIYMDKHGRPPANMDEVKETAVSSNGA